MSDLETWRCTFNSQNNNVENIFNHTTLITYALDEYGVKLLGMKPPFYHQMFRHYTGRQRLSMLVVTQANLRKRNPLPSDECHFVLGSVRDRLPSNYKCGSDCHYSFKSASVKLDVLKHVPQEVSRVILLDADIHCVKDCVTTFETEFNQLNSRQFIAAGRSGVRDLVTRIADGKSVPAVHKGVYGGLQSGVLGLDLVKMRRWERVFCPDKPWWHCVVASRPLSFKWGFADQLVYRELITDQPWIWKEMPCGMHADTQVLQGIALHTDCGNRFHLFRSEGERHHYRSKQWLNADYCITDTTRVAFTHDAGGMHRFATGVAMAISNGDEKDACPTDIDILIQQHKGSHIQQSPL